MHYKPQPRIWLRVAAFILAVALFVGVFAWLAAPLLLRVPAVKPTVPQGTVQGLLLEINPAQLLAPEMLEDTFAADIAFAQKNGCNALFVQVKQGDTVLYRDSAFPMMKSVSDTDTFLHRYDPLKALCSAASRAKLPVYAVAEAADTLKSTQESLARMAHKYSVSGVYLRSTQNGSVLYQGWQPNAQTPSAAYLVGADEAAFASPGTVFLHTMAENFSGIVYSADAAKANAQGFSVLCSTMDTAAVPPAPLTYTPPAALSISQPKNDAVFSGGDSYIMGTSNPAEPLLLDGKPVERTGKNGTFGVLVSLAEGDNTFTFTQGDTSVPLHLVRKTPEPSTAEPVPDNTKEVPAGTYVRATGWVNSLLFDPASDGNISETVRRGAVMRVESSVQTTRGNKQTWAYQLASGDFIMAYNTETVGTGLAQTAFSGASAKPTETGETLTFEGEGTPVAYTNKKDNELILHFYDTVASEPFAVQGSSMVLASKAQPIENGCEITLSFAAPLYGYSIEYEGTRTLLTLKHTPRQSTQPGKPLQGVSVLLDAGHGKDDFGALGVPGTDAPVEKDVNLAVTLAAKYRLEQMGATVYTVRTDDSFLTLQERNELLVKTQPDYFIAIHHNSLELTVDGNKATGTEAYYFYPDGKQLGKTLVENVTKAVSRESRGNEWGYYYVTRSTVCPAVLLELGFMINPAEYDAIIDAKNIWAEGDAIARSVLACTPAAQGK